MSGIVGTSHSKSKVIGRSKDTAKAWVNFNGTGDPIVGIRDSFNCSSITDLGPGLYQINFITAMSNANYAAGGLSSYDLVTNPYRHVHWYRRTTTYMSVTTIYNVSTTAYDAQEITLIVFGD